MFETYEIVGLLGCFFLSGFFSGSEAVLLSVGIDRAKQLIDDGGRKGRALQFMTDRPNEILTTILVGNNVANILAASLTTTIAARIFENDALSISVGVTTIIILIFGEIIPKTFARVHAEGLAVPVITVLKLCYYAMYPVIKSLSWIIHQVLGKNAKLHGSIVTNDDIEYMINKAEKEKTMDSKQLDLLSSIMEFPTIKVKDIMIPRSKVKAIKIKAKDARQEFWDIINFLKCDTHSRYPVCTGSLDHTIGFLHVKDLAFVNAEVQKDFNIKNYLKAPFFVYEHMKIQAIFDHMNRKKVHLALVKDENGLVVGIITLEDIVEEIFGEIQDEHDKDEDQVVEHCKSDDCEAGILVDGTISIRDLHTDFDIYIPLNDNFSTLAGFILDMLGNNFPEQGQIIVWEGYSFELEKVDDFEIREIRIKDVDGEKHIFSKSEAESESESETVESSLKNGSRIFSIAAKSSNGK